MKTRIFIFSTVALTLFLGLISPYGVRAAIDNNLWSLVFIRQVAKNDQIDPLSFSPPPTHQHAGLLLAHQALKLDQPKLALELITPIANTTNPLVLDTYAQILFLGGNYAEAIGIWRAIGAWQTLYHASSVFNRQDQIDYIILALEGAYELRPEVYARNLLSYKLLRANYYLNNQRYQEAIQAYQDIIRQFPQEDRAYLGLIQAYFNLGEFDNTYHAIQAAWELNQNNLNFFIFVAEIYRHMELPDQALNAYHTALQIDPNSSVALQGIAELTGADE